MTAICIFFIDILKYSLDIIGNKNIIPKFPSWEGEGVGQIRISDNVYYYTKLSFNKSCFRMAKSRFRDQIEYGYA